ncbi:RidA family protein [Arcicella lustrica]|uniref:RidA family protein n=1 Tax=Arcicella lustrica TaxID=2984196 RepID=A0ABU5SK27_9BACT|nr:RidA family protein [Arcicella sp. DC25W]MEA5427655.1 RidA family protein [Arcicella sp. DC25W]
MKKLILLCLLFFSVKVHAQTPEEQLTKLGITLPTVSQPVASYVNVVRTGNLLFLSGKGPLKADGQYIKGKLGKDLTIEEGAKAAELAAIQQLAVLKATLGDLSKVKRIVKVLGFVNSDSEFFDHPKVINGTSNLMIQVFGEKGKHARSALGVNALPFNMAVEVEMIVEVE